MKYRILIVEDNIMLAGQQKKRLEKSGYEAEITIDEPGARKLLKKESFDLVLSDVRLPEGDGISLLEWMRKERMDIPFIIMTGYASVPDAVQAIKLGAKDYLAKPVQMDELQRQLKDIFRPKSVICDKNKDLLPRNSLQMQEVEHLVSTVAPFDISVLILGPNGAGKESVAQRIHYIGERKDMPFVAVNCGVIPKELAPSLFFGHIKGTFTGADANKDGYFEVAKGGTLFLDEIGDLTASIQPQLLRFLQDHEYERVGDPTPRQADVRLIAATNRNLEEAVKTGAFREDLFYRLNVFQLEIPPLRERPEDLEMLAENMLRFFAAANRKLIRGFSPEASEAIKAYPWPGNLRELRNAVERGVILTDSDTVLLHHLPDALQHLKGEVSPNGRLTLEQLEENYIREVLTTSSSLVEAASILGINQATLWRKRKAYGINN